MPARPSPRGFTLIELTVSMAIASVVVAAAVAAIVSILGLMKRAERQTAVDQEAKILGEYLVARLQELGGGALRPWHGLQIEENWSGDGTDRLVFVELDESARECPILKQPGAGVVIQADPADCCLGPAFENRQVVATTPGGEYWVSLFLNTVNNHNCQVNFQPGLTFSRPPEDLFDFLGGALIPVRVMRIWLDSATNRLMLDQDVPGTNDFTSSVLADNVYDLQFAFAYDANPADGVLLDDNSAQDEWLGNHADDQFGQGGLEKASESDLRMIAVGLVVGAPVPQLGLQSASVLNGPARTATDVILRPLVGRAYLRNLNFFF